MSRGAKKDVAATRLFRVGDRVRIRFGEYPVDGVVVEDRGPLGFGGRRLYRIEFNHEVPPDPVYTELPAEEIELVESKK